MGWYANVGQAVSVIGGLWDEGATTIILVAAGLTAILVVLRLIRKAILWVWRGIKEAKDLFDRVEKAIQNVEAQLYPNGGASLRDAVDQIQRRLVIIETAVNDRKPGDQTLSDNVQDLHNDRPEGSPQVGH